ncbi:MAG: hypothetical protein KGL52_01020 [Rhodospirillales bacterium]|nr:hypothetical protein [Rhodospirillales bacterium]
MLTTTIGLAPDRVKRAVPPVATKPRPPVFLHTGWRSAGTWLWSRFRTLPSVVAYYEPLNPIVDALTPATLASYSSDTWASGHPSLEHAYFHEYGDLLRHARPGIARFEPGFAVADFFAEATADLPDLRAYIAMLNDHASSNHGRAVLKFCRSIGRVGWMQRNFPDAAHVVIARNPAAQFSSARRQYARHANPYFLAMPWLVLTHNRDDTRVAEALRCFDVQLPILPAHASAATTDAVLRRHLSDTDPADWYRAFLAFWTLAALSIPETIDCVIDSDLLTISPRYRVASQRDLAALTGMPVELGDEPHAIEPTAGIGIPRAAVWRCHQAARALVLARHGAAWVDTALGARIGAMLAQADLIAMDGHAALAARSLDAIEGRDRLRLLAEDAQQARVQVQRELDLVYASRSWKLTEPLRQIHTLVRPPATRGA